MPKICSWSSNQVIIWTNHTSLCLNCASCLSLRTEELDKVTQIKYYLQRQRMLLPRVTHLALWTGPGTQVKASFGGPFWINRHSLIRVLMSLFVFGCSSHFTASSPTSPGMGMKSTMGCSRPNKPLFRLPEISFPIGPWKHSPDPVLPSGRKLKNEF